MNYPSEEYDPEEESRESLSLPQLLAVSAKGMPWKPNARFDVSPYSEAIAALKERGYSFAEIASWLKEQLASQLNGTSIGRGQVYRVYKQYLEFQHQEMVNAFEAGDVIEAKHVSISDEEAEKKAAEEDETPVPLDKSAGKKSRTKK
jgi:hypothetical protein